MLIPMKQKISIASINFQLSEEMRAEIRDMLVLLFNSPVPIRSVKLTLEGDYARSNVINYTANILLELRGSEIIASTRAAQLKLAVQGVVQEAQSQLAERAHSKGTITAA